LKKTVSWVLFDFAETVFSASIISVFFPLWVVNQLKGASYHYSFVYSLSVISSIALGIFLGRLADRYGLKDRLFKFFVLGVAVLLYSLYFVEGLYTALTVFFFMNLFYQQSLIFYNSLLTDISNREGLGVVSGFGIGLGYIGGIVSLLIANYLSSSPSQVFLITALLFTVFAVPSLLFVNSGKTDVRQDFSFKELVKDRRFFLFLLSVFLLTDGAHGVIVFMSLYLNRVFGFDQTGVVNTVAVAGVFAVLSAPVSGYFISRIGGRVFLKYLFPLWTVAFWLLFLSDGRTVYGVAVLFGILLASLWTAVRVALIEFSPQNQITTRFAFMSVSERMASVLSPVVWSFAVMFIGENSTGYKTAVLLLSLFPLAGFFVYRRFLN